MLALIHILRGIRPSTKPGTVQTLYVGLTRGRHANHAYTATDTPPPGDAHPDVQHKAVSAREILTGILTTTGTEDAATTASRTAATEAVSPDRLWPVAATLTADITRRRWTRLLTEHLDPSVGQVLRGDPRIGTLHAALARAETAGHTPGTILNRLTLAVDHTKSDDLARDLARTIDAWADAATPPGLINSRDPLRHRPVADPDDPAAPVLDEIHHIVNDRAARALARVRHESPVLGDHQAPTYATSTPATLHVEGPSFAAETIRRWWITIGATRLPGRHETADHRGRRRLQRLPTSAVEEGDSRPRRPDRHTRSRSATCPPEHPNGTGSNTACSATSR